MYYDRKIVESIMNPDYKYTKAHLTVYLKLVNFMTTNHILIKMFKKR